MMIVDRDILQICLIFININKLFFNKLHEVKMLLMDFPLTLKMYLKTFFFG